MSNSAAHLNQRGVTLIELMITLVVLGILVAIAVPNYTQRVIKSKRTDATTALLTIAAEQEKFYIKNNRYAANTSELGITKTDNQYYGLAIALGDGGGYVATATPLTGGSQTADDYCKSFSIDHTGKKIAAGSDSGGTTVDTSDVCW